MSRIRIVSERVDRYGHHLQHEMPVVTYVEIPDGATLGRAVVLGVILGVSASCLLFLVQLGA